MLPFSVSSPAEISVALGRRIQARRLAHGWTQRELAERAGVALDTLKKFERTGQVSLLRLVRLVIALGGTDELEALLASHAPRSLDDLTRPRRQRGRTRGSR